MATRHGPGKPPAIHPDDREHFLTEVGDAMPLAWDRVHHEPPPPPAIPRQHHRDERAALAESVSDEQLLDRQLEGGDQAAWCRPGLPPSLLRDLRRGRWVLQDKLDLHGMNREEARLAIADFLQQARQRGLRCVRVVHGKGLRSPGREPVLKRLVLGWLTQRREVMAFCQARAAEGGAGAVVVLLAAGA